MLTALRSRVGLAVAAAGLVAASTLVATGAVTPQAAPVVAPAKAEAVITSASRCNSVKYPGYIRWTFYENQYITPGYIRILNTSGTVLWDSLGNQIPGTRQGYIPSSYVPYRVQDGYFVNSAFTLLSTQFFTNLGACPAGA